MKTVSVIGIGKLGSVISDIFAEKYHVIRIDKKPREGCTTSFDKLGDLTFIIVPTPSLQNNKFDSSHIEEVLIKITKHQIVVIMSTVMPGEIDRLQDKYKHLTLIYNPAFIALGSIRHDFLYPDFVLIGGRNLDAIDTLVKFYKTILLKLEPKFSILLPIQAEISKLALNCYITTKITFANQIGNLCYRAGVHPEYILQTIGQDKRIGNNYFKAGLGYGGPCFPRDNLALCAYMRDLKADSTFLSIVHILNEKQTDEIVNRVVDLKPKTVGFSGLSYKEGTDYEEKSALKEIYTMLKAMGYDVKIGKGDVNINWGGIE